MFGVSVRFRPWMTSSPALLVAALNLGPTAACSSGAPPPAPTAARSPAQDSVGTLKLASSRWPPFTDVYGNQHAALDVVSEALLRSGYVATTSLLMEGAIDGALQTGEFDGCPAAWRSPEREAWLLYSSPYLENRLVLVGREGTRVDITSLSALAGKRLGLVRGFAYGELSELAASARLVRDFSIEDNVQALLDGKLDYILADALVVHRVLQWYPSETAARLRVGTMPLLRRPLHLALRRSLPGAEGVLAAFERSLAAMLADGSYHRALDVLWISSDVTGDATPELIGAATALGTTPPAQAYALLSSSSASDTAAQRRFMVAGQLYDSWQAVPAQYRRQRPR